MRTTIRLDDALLRRAKAHAAASGRSLNDFVADAVRAALTPRAQASTHVDLPTFKGDGLRAGVDLDDSAALLDLMDADSDWPVQSSVQVRAVAERPRRRGK